MQQLNQTGNKKIKDSTILLTLLSIGFGIPLIYILSIAAPYFRGGTEEISITNDPNIGRILSFNSPMAYVKNARGESAGKRISEINNELECVKDVEAFGILNDPKDMKLLPLNMGYEIIGVINIREKGVNADIGEGPPSSNYFVFKDDNGIISTKSSLMLDETGCLSST